MVVSFCFGKKNQEVKKYLVLDHEHESEPSKQNEPMTFSAFICFHMTITTRTQETHTCASNIMSSVTAVLCPSFNQLSNNVMHHVTLLPPAAETVYSQISARLKGSVKRRKVTLHGAQHGASESNKSKSRDESEEE